MAIQVRGNDAQATVRVSVPEDGSNHMAEVFISFIHQEGYAEAVQRFVRALLGERAQPFLSSDKFQVYAGERWLDKDCRGTEHSQAGGSDVEQEIRHPTLGEF